MIQTESTLADLYKADETAWLDAMAELIGKGDLASLDYEHLKECLSDMARRDRREIESGLLVLIAHILKWLYQPDKRTSSWRGAIRLQRRELSRAAGQGVLRNHAESVPAEMYQDAVSQAAIETELPENTFPTECPYSLEQLLSVDLTADDQ